MAAEAPEGIVLYSNANNPTFVDTSDVLGKKHTNTEFLQLTDTFVETLDLISEGVIQGPVSGQWVFSGNLNQIGWSSGYFSGYTTPSGFASSAWLNSIYWNELPVLSSAGQFNFQNVDLTYTVGNPNGDTLQSLTNQETTSRTIGTTLYAGFENAQVFRILNTNCKGVIINIKLSTLSNTDNNPNDANYGAIERTSIQYTLGYRPVFSTILKNAAYSSPITKNLFGKITSAGGYIDSTEIDFNLITFISSSNGLPINDPVGFLNDPDFVGWEIIVTRITADSTSALLVNSTIIDSITELYGTQLSYPNSAIVRSTFDAQFFASIPQRGFVCDFIKVQIPANYDPIMRTYSTTGYGTTNGYWNGAFASGLQWTNNPSWCFYDLITNTRYGLGKFIDNIDVYKFDLYNIAQYCDQLVADGWGGLEPRFTCNVWIAQKAEAYKVINDMASVFRGLVYYFNGNLNAVQDAPKSPRTLFTNANVENGDFQYASTSKSTRQSVAVVRYNDPLNFYKPAIEYVDDLDAIRRYGVKELPLTAFGCTSRGQAIRLGKWALLSNNLETETVTFNAGLEANLLRCGDVFQVFDYNRKSKRYGGRVVQLNNSGYVGNGFTGASILLDATVDISTGVNYEFSLLTPTYYYDPSMVTGLTSNDYSNIYRTLLQTISFSGDSCYNTGNQTVINLTSGFDNVNYNLSGNPVWSIELGPNSINYTGNFYFSSTGDYYRVLNIKETDSNKYQVIGLSYNVDKFNQIDSGISFSQVNAATQFVPVPSTPRNLSLSAYILNKGNSQKYIQYSFIVDDFSNTTNYQVFLTTGFFSNNIGLPNSKFLVNTLPSNVVNATYFIQTPSFVSGTNTTTYSLIIYGYNSNYGSFSTGFASGSINVSQNLPITDVIVGGLGIA